LAKRISIQQSRFFRGKAKEAKIRMILKGVISICLALLGYLMTDEPLFILEIVLSIIHGKKIFDFIKKLYYY